MSETPSEVNGIDVSPGEQLRLLLQLVDVRLRDDAWNCFTSRAGSWLPRRRGCP
jgi:hypothetical protein